jgi:hypothetical protein
MDCLMDGWLVDEWNDEWFDQWMVGWMDGRNLGLD